MTHLAPLMDGASPNRRPAVAIALGLYLAVQLAGCGGEPRPARAPHAADVANVTVDPPQLTLQAGGEGWLGAQADDAAGQPIGGASFVFLAEDPGLLKVSERGQVIALGPATPQTSVIVSSGGRERRVPVTVLPGAPARVEGVSGDGQRVTAGEPAGEPLIARLVDGFGNSIGNEPMVIESAAGFFDPIEAVSGQDGATEVRLPPVRRAGEVLVSIRHRDLASVAGAFRIDVVPAAPAAIELLPAPPEASPVRAATLRASDGFGNPVPGVQIVAEVPGAEGEPTALTTDATGLAILDLSALAQDEAVAIEASLSDGSLRTRLEVPPQAPPAPPPGGT